MFRAEDKHVLGHRNMQKLRNMWSGSGHKVALKYSQVCLLPAKSFVSSCCYSVLIIITIIIIIASSTYTEHCAECLILNLLNKICGASLYSEEAEARVHE